MRVRYTGSYLGVLEGHRRWSPGEERDVSDEVATQLTRGHGALWEQVAEGPQAIEDAPADDESVVVTTPDEPTQTRRRRASQES